MATSYARCENESRATDISQVLRNGILGEWTATRFRSLDVRGKIDVPLGEGFVVPRPAQAPGCSRAERHCSVAESSEKIKPLSSNKYPDAVCSNAVASTFRFIFRFVSSHRCANAVITSELHAIAQVLRVPHTRKLRVGPFSWLPHQPRCQPEVAAVPGSPARVAFARAGVVATEGSAFRSIWRLQMVPG